MTSAASPDSGLLVYFVFLTLGLLTIVASAWQRFNEPSFKAVDTLPHVEDPLRYLFLRDAYKKARCAYVAAVVSIYLLFVAPGPEMAKALQALGVKEFSPQTWALMVALLMAGLLPNSNLKFLVMIETWLRRVIHGWFLVPDGVQRTIGILRNADYKIPDEYDTIPQEIRDAFKQPRRSLRYRWARASMLMESLNCMGAGLAHANFDPFQEDFEDICARYKALAQEIRGADENDKDLSRSVDKLLNRIYTYISWGVRYQADSQSDAERMLKQLGFDIPDLGDRRLFDIVAPPIVIVAFITAVFWLTADGIGQMLYPSEHFALSDSVLNAVISAIAASFMYGCAVFIALNKRADQIKHDVWRQGSPTGLVPIAIKAGAMTCFVIIITTVALRLPDTLQSLAALAKLLVPVSLPGGAAAAALSGTAAAASNADTAATIVSWNFLPIRVAMALPWILAGATVSVTLAYFLGGDVRRTDKAHAVRDSIVMGVALGLSVAVAQGIQTAVAEHLDPQGGWGYVPLVGFAGLLCGAVIGYMVPRACRDNLITPTDPATARLLGNLLARAQNVRGSEQAAREWAFSPNKELRGLTPAEAVQYERLQADVWRLADGKVGAGKPRAPKDGDPPSVVTRDVVSPTPNPGIVPAE
jgi:hypothetical protein